MWVTESGDAGGGGNTWASTYVDVFRTLNELGTFSTITDGVIFHNTLASSDYGFLKHGTFDPRPNYFAVLLWNRIMGTTVFDTKEEILLDFRHHIAYKKQQHTCHKANNTSYVNSCAHCNRNIGCLHCQKEQCEAKKEIIIILAETLIITLLRIQFYHRHRQNRNQHQNSRI